MSRLSGKREVTRNFEPMSYYYLEQLLQILESPCMFTPSYKL